MSSYNINQYRTSKWQHIRSIVLERDHHTCVRCGRKYPDVTLNVHHIEYRKGAKAWEYSTDELMTLCSGCHAEEHGKKPPTYGWEYCGMEDLGDLTGECELCGHEIRYEHSLFHKKWGYIVVGSQCAESLLNNGMASEEEELCKKKAARFRRYLNSPKWKSIRRGYKYDNLDDFIILIWDNYSFYTVQINFRYFKGHRAYYDNRRGKIKHRTIDDAKKAAFESITSGKMATYVEIHFGPLKPIFSEID